ncbi:phospholipid phosphatase 5-like [Argonauta hians]
MKILDSFGAEALLRTLFFLIYVLTDGVKPFQRNINPEELWLYKNPETPSYVPVKLLWVIVIIIPMVSIVSCYLRNRNKTDVSCALMGVTLSIFLTASLTNVIKLIVGRPRPDFFWRCFPDGKFVPNMLCTGVPQKINEGRKSFPSGHSSIAFAGLGFMTLYLFGKLHYFGQHGYGSTWRLVASIAPMFVATLVALSRYCDYHHHWQDITVGSLLGFIIAYNCYRQSYPALNSKFSHLPLSSIPNSSSSSSSSLSSSAEGNLDSINIGNNQLSNYRSSDKNSASLFKSDSTLKMV